MNLEECNSALNKARTELGKMKKDKQGHQRKIIELLELEVMRLAANKKD